MAINIETLRALVPISVFSKGQATQVFDRLKTEPQLVVLKNNVPAAILLSPEEYERMAQIESDYNLLALAQQRLSASKTALDEAQVMDALGITPADVDAAQDVALE